MPERYGIGEWYGQPLLSLTPAQRRNLALAALGERNLIPQCPFQRSRPTCSKKGGVCSLRRYTQSEDGRIGEPVGGHVITCPARFEEDNLLVLWLADIVGFAPGEASIAREVPFMQGTSTNKPAGKIDLVVAKTSNDGVTWHGLEIQAVYFSGKGMQSEFHSLLDDTYDTPPFPTAIRRPDWRSSSAKRLMPQLQIKAPTLRRWGSKLAVAVDRPFFEAVGGPSPNPSRDLNEGDIIWLVPEIVVEGGRAHLSRWHWEVLTLEASTEKLLAAKTIRRRDFEQALLLKLKSTRAGETSGQVTPPASAAPAGH